MPDGLSGSWTSCSTGTCRGTDDQRILGTVSATETTEKARAGRVLSARTVTAAAVACLAVAALLVLAGCGGGDGGKGASSGSTETSAPVGRGMAGASQKVIISKQAVAEKPDPWVLSDPEAAVRSYLEWTSYAYRIAESSAATPTMSAEQEVRVDSYVQLNLQKERILDQLLQSIKFGKAKVGATSTVLPATESWTYRYVSIKDVGKTVAGPYAIGYETTYTVIKNGKGDWVVDTITVKPLGEVK